MKKSKQLIEAEIIWYKILKDSDFQDIENTKRDMLNKWEAIMFARKDATLMSTTLEYYIKAEHFLNNYPFRSQIEKEIWRFHSEGYGTRQINLEFKVYNIGLNKDKIAHIISKLRKIMLNEG